MIGTELLKGQGLGNALFCYITTRCIAKRQQTDFAILGKEVLEGIAGKKNGLYFMNLDFGLQIEKSEFKQVYHEKDDRLFLGNSRHDCKLGCYVTGMDKDFLNAEDGTLLYGNMQAEEYILPYKNEIKQWLKVKPEYDSFEFSKDNLCIINIRGGEYTGSPELFLSRRYWLNGIKYMKQIRADMEFMIVTDDVEAAGKVLPEIPAYHFSLDKDYVTVKNAKYVLLSNSSFAFFPVFTSETIKEIVAPKYWARHNVSNGYWASEQNIYTDWKYMDRNGVIFSAEECRKELQKYKETNKKFKKLNIKPGKIQAFWMKAESELLYYASWINRIYRSFIKRAKKLLKNN